MKRMYADVRIEYKLYGLDKRNIRRIFKVESSN